MSSTLLKNSIPDRNKKTIMITGAAGFIGNSLVNRYLNGNDIIAVDVVKPEIYFSKYSQIKYSYVYCDLSDELSVTNLIYNIPKPDVIIHLAGVTRVKDALADPIRAISLNILATSNLYLKYKNFLDKNKISGSFIFISTAELANIMNATIIPSVYSITKKTCEDLLRSFHNGSYLKTSIIRLCTVYGGELEKKDKLPRLFLEKANKDSEIVIEYENNVIPSYIHINDCIDLITSVEEKTSSSDNRSIITYTLSGEKMSLEGLISIIEKISGKKVKFRYAEHNNIDSETEKYDLNFVNLKHKNPRSLYDGLKGMLEFGKSIGE